MVEIVTVHRPFLEKAGVAVHDEIVTVHRPSLEKAGVAVHDETHGVTSIVVHKTPFGVVLNFI